MQPGELIVVQLKDGPAIGRYSAAPDADRKGSAGRVRVAIGRNREARLPRDRVMMWTGLVPTDDSEAEETPLLTAEGGEPTGPFETPSGVEDDSQTEETPLVTAEPVAGGQSEEALSKPAPADDGSASEGAAAAPAEHGTAGSARRSLEIIDILPKDRILAVFDPTFLTVEEAEGQMMNPGELVIGLSIDGDSRAYPVPFLSSREIVNDVVGGKPVAVTW